MLIAAEVSWAMRLALARWMSSSEIDMKSRRRFFCAPDFVVIWMRSDHWQQERVAARKSLQKGQDSYHQKAYVRCIADQNDRN
eukprot:8507986-Ditylum_brightwellii.AAC.1